MALTLVEAVVLLVIAAVLAGVLLPALSHSRESKERSECKGNCGEIGKGLYAYSQNNDEYYPFLWDGPFSPFPSGNGAAQAGMAMSGIALLYPQYLARASVFRCPQTQDRPFFSDGIPPRPSFGCSGSGPLPPSPALRPGSGWKLFGSSYGYDCRVSPQAVSNHAVLADMDGTYCADRTSGTQNHYGGQSVLYFDGHASWVGNNCASSDPKDNIFVEDPWNADTDSYIIRTDGGLTRSFDSYPALHLPAK
jgi:type II secretory pathway pseudopilin PulG